MAKIMKYQEDKLSPMLLSSAAVILITWLSIAAQVGINYWYYFGGLLVSFMWGLANYSRSPRQYKSGRAAGFTYMMMGVGLIISVSFITMVFRNPERFSEYLNQP